MSLPGELEERTIHRVWRGMKRGVAGGQDGPGQGQPGCPPTGSDLSTGSHTQALVKNAGPGLPDVFDPNGHLNPTPKDSGHVKAGEALC